MHIRARESKSSIGSEMIISTSSNSTDDSEINEKTPTPENSDTLQLSLSTRSSQVNSNQIEIVRLDSRLSKGEIKLSDMIREINEITVLDEEEEQEEEIAAVEKTIPTSNFLHQIQQSRRFLRSILNKSAFHYTIIILIIVDLIVVFIDLVLGE
ncbi:unnamed protein product [Rotaria sp. Silwood1]|nr:unnamed protein product [Rotaria sp. Silwood1]CAF3529213.1 unnamed protein product [Rotaria sp. Silwood1]CAF3619625.1 unnamed protein product [Rotaria sp. Silwood1]CAF3702216.1 unnamed protein product [Rotaria sp. Silwood1]CAF4586409.1 unnamed protein product [Rotaria sp. Silwood1]